MSIADEDIEGALEHVLRGPSSARAKQLASRGVAAYAACIRACSEDKSLELSPDPPEVCLQRGMDSADLLEEIGDVVAAVRLDRDVESVLEDAVRRLEQWPARWNSL